MDVGYRPVGDFECAGNVGGTPSYATTRPTISPPNAPVHRPLTFAIRTTVAALLALTSAHLLGIHHPWWAAMTVWLVAQPTRGLLIERSLARLTGTIWGAVAGALILISWAHDLPIALTVLAFWLALCAGLGTIFRHFRNYGFVLAGYTAGIVVLFGLSDGHADAVLAQDRVLCTLIGIACSTLLSFRALPLKHTNAGTHARSLLDRVLRLVESEPAEQRLNTDPTLVAEIGTFDRAIDDYAAGSLRRRFDALRLRHISGVLLELVALARSGQGGVTAADEKQDDPLQRVRSLAGNAVLGDRPALANALGDLVQALEPDRQTAWSHFRFDFNPVEAVRAAGRPVLALALAAIIWLASGWQAGAMMAMTAVLFTSLFSSHDHGNHMVIQVMIGTLAGAAAGLLTRLFLLPQADGLLLPMLVCITPFLLVSAWLMRQSATGKMAIDMAMTFLLTAQPGSAPVTAEIALPEAVAIVSGVFIAVTMFWLVLPSTPAVRCGLMARRIVHLTALIARSPDRASSRSRHEALRSTFVRLLDAAAPDGPLFTAAQACLASAADARSLNSHSARVAALEASVALDALITSNTRRKCNA